MAQGIDVMLGSDQISAVRIDELTVEAISIMQSLVNRPHAIEDSPTLQLLFADQLVMGSPARVSLTSQGGRLLFQLALQRIK